MYQIIGTALINFSDLKAGEEKVFFSAKTRQTAERWLQSWIRTEGDRWSFRLHKS